MKRQWVVVLVVLGLGLVARPARGQSSDPWELGGVVNAAERIVRGLKPDWLQSWSSNWGPVGESPAATVSVSPGDPRDPFAACRGERTRASSSSSDEQLARAAHDALCYVYGYGQSYPFVAECLRLTRPTAASMYECVSPEGFVESERAALAQLNSPVRDELPVSVDPRLQELAELDPPGLGEAFRENPASDATAQQSTGPLEYDFGTGELSGALADLDAPSFDAANRTQAVASGTLDEIAWPAHDEGFGPYAESFEPVPGEPIDRDAMDADSSEPDADDDRSPWSDDFENGANADAQSDELGPAAASDVRGANASPWRFDTAASLSPVLEPVAPPVARLFRRLGRSEAAVIDLFRGTGAPSESSDGTNSLEHGPLRLAATERSVLRQADAPEADSDLEASPVPAANDQPLPVPSWSPSDPAAEITAGATQLWGNVGDALRVGARRFSGLATGVRDRLVGLWTDI